jgi:hypothetical protein
MSAPTTVIVCGAPTVAWLPAAARPERHVEVWMWGTGGEGRRRCARWSGRELTRGAARRGGGRGAAARQRSARSTVVGMAASRAELPAQLTDMAEASSA